MLGMIEGMRFARFDLRSYRAQHAQGSLAAINIDKQLGAWRFHLSRRPCFLVFLVITLQIRLRWTSGSFIPSRCFCTPGSKQAFQSSEFYLRSPS